ncbi:methyltransferase domain-containing protein, partial [Craurococcus roseus]|uniref:methyltransferase domain-containing protein n=1 Tax=Craurococcus roseus TaxID=77585 RepID=UPI0031D23C87
PAGGRFFVLDAEREELPAALRGTFDAIVMESCVHHFLDPVSALAHIAAGLKEDGIAVVIEGENRRGPIRPEYLAVMREFDTLERPYTRPQMERMLVLAGLPAFRFLGRVNGWFAPDDPRVPLLPEMVRDDARARNLAVCARTPAALARVLPGLRAG